MDVEYNVFCYDFALPPKVISKDFVGCTFNDITENVQFLDCTFEDCTFGDCKLMLTACLLDNCKFFGTLFIEVTNTEIK